MNSSPHRSPPSGIRSTPHGWMPIGIVALAATVLAAWTPSDGGPGLCPIRLCTGVACPGCGLTRATSRLLHGDLSGALVYHPLVLLAVMEVVAAAVVWPLLRTGRVKLDIRLLNAVLIANGVLLLGVWMLRAANGTLPT